jgi:tetratricopeptide (TPR) repeat protein
MDRQHRHDLKHDKFVDEIGVLSSKARANQRLLLAIAGSAIAIALIVYGIYFYRSNREDKAQQLLATAIETFEAPVGDVPPGQQQQQTGPRFKTEQERTAAAEKQFKAVQAEYAGSDASDVAGLYLARLAMNLTKAEPPLPGDALLVLLAQAYEVQGNREKSLEAYRRLASEFPESPYAIDANRRIGTA